MQVEYTENKFSCTFINEIQRNADNKLREYYQKNEIDLAYDKLSEIANVQHHYLQKQSRAISSSLTQTFFFKNSGSSNIKELPSQQSIKLSF